MKEYKIVVVKANSKKNMVEKTENTMNEMAKEGWNVTTMTEFIACEFGYSILVAFEKET